MCVLKYYKRKIQAGPMFGDYVNGWILMHAILVSKLNILNFHEISINEGHRRIFETTGGSFRSRRVSVPWKLIPGAK